MSDNASTSICTAFISLALAAGLFFICQCHSNEYGFLQQREAKIVEEQTKVRTSEIELQKSQASIKENWEIVQKSK